MIGTHGGIALHGPILLSWTCFDKSVWALSLLLLMTTHDVIQTVTVVTRNLVVVVILRVYTSIPTSLKLPFPHLFISLLLKVAVHPVRVISNLIPASVPTGQIDSHLFGWCHRIQNHLDWTGCSHCPLVWDQSQQCSLDGPRHNHSHYQNNDWRLWTGGRICYNVLPPFGKD